jgi:hypothetical protein
MRSVVIRVTRQGERVRLHHDPGLSSAMREFLLRGLGLG